MLIENFLINIKLYFDEPSFNQNCQEIKEGCKTKKRKSEYIFEYDSRYVLLWYVYVSYHHSGLHFSKNMVFVDSGYVVLNSRKQNVCLVGNSALLVLAVDLPVF